MVLQSPEIQADSLRLSRPVVFGLLICLVSINDQGTVFLVCSLNKGSPT